MKKTFRQAFIESLCDDTGLGSNIRFISYGCYLLSIIPVCRGHYTEAAMLIGAGIIGKVTQKKLSENKSK